jgi:hypothetical protein
MGQRIFDTIVGALLGSIIIGAVNAAVGWFHGIGAIWTGVIWFAISFVIIMAITQWQENRLKKHLGLAQERWNKLREERMKYRQIYADRVNVSKVLLQLQQYTINEVEKQQVSPEDAKCIPAELLKATNKLALVPALIWYFAPMSLKRFIKIKGFLAQALLNWNAVLKRHNLGAMVVIEQKPYKDLYQQIIDYKVGLPRKTVAKIEMCIMMSDLLSSTVLLTTSKVFADQLQSLGAVRNILPYMAKGIDLNADELRS